MQVGIINFTSLDIFEIKYFLSPSFSNVPASGLNRIMKPNQIKAVVGLHKISDYKNEVSRSETERPVEMSVKNLIVHPGMEWLFLLKFLDHSTSLTFYLSFLRIRLR